MHEYALAEDIVKIAQAAGIEHGGKSISEIQLEIGKVSGVEIEAIRFALEVICKNTFSHSVKVTIDEIAALARCRTCQKEYNLEDLYSLCPYCSAYDREILQGKELRVKAVTIE